MNYVPSGSLGLQDYFGQVAATLGRMPIEPLERLVRILQDAQSEGRQLFLFGNGGSSANASHIVNDLVKSALVPGKPRFKAVCLSDNTPILTAIANDISYEEVFAIPLEALAAPGDVAIALSGSGNSPNVLRAMEVARGKGMICVGLTGRDGGRLAPMCDIAVIVPSDSMQVIEDGHLVLLHAAFLALMA